MPAGSVAEEDRMMAAEVPAGRAREQVRRAEMPTGCAPEQGREKSAQRHLPDRLRGRGPQL